MSYTFAAPTMVAGGTLRSTRDPGSSVTFSQLTTYNALRVYAIHWESTGTTTLTGFTIAGVNVPIITQTNVSQTGNNSCGIALAVYRYPNAPSATVNIVTNFNGPVQGSSIGLWSLFRNSIDTPYSFQTTTKDSSTTTKDITMSIPPRSLSVVAVTNLSQTSITFAITSPPTITSSYNQDSPVTSSAYRMAGATINNGSSATDYPTETVTVTSSINSGAYATITFI